MSTIWISDAQELIYTIAKTRAKNNLIATFPDILFTRDSESQTSTHFPTVFIHFLPYAELNPDLDGSDVNGFICGLQLDVITSKAQGRKAAGRIMYEVIDQFKRLRFRLLSSPEFLVTGNDTKRIVARLQRNLGSGDIL